MQGFFKQTTLPPEASCGPSLPSGPKACKETSAVFTHNQVGRASLYAAVVHSAAPPIPTKFQPPRLFDQVMAGLREHFVSITADGWTKTQGSEHVLNLMPHVMAVHPEASATPCCQVDVAGPGVLACWWSLRVLYSYLYKKTSENNIKQSIFCCCMLGNHDKM